MLADGMDVNAKKNFTAHFAEALGNVFLYRSTAYEPSYSLRTCLKSRRDEVK
jgi:hypothetical protein